MPKIFHQARRFLLIVIVFLFLFTEPSQAFAQGNSGSSQDYYKKSEQGFLGFLHAASCVITGVSVLENPCFTNSLANGEFKKYSLGGSVGLLPVIGSAFDTLLSSKPLSTSEYLTQMTTHLNPIKEANAQVSGSGSSILSVIFKFWMAARNAAYILMTIVFVVVGVMILIGRKSGQQSVLSVQAALPGMVIGLVMITFSYFFAALLVDIAFVGSYVGGNLLNQGQLTTAVHEEVLRDRNVLDLGFTFIRIEPGLFEEILQAFGAANEMVGFLIRGSAGMIAYKMGDIIAPLFQPLINGVIGGLARGAPVASGLATFAAGAVGPKAVQILFIGLSQSKPEFLVSMIMWLVLILAIVYQMVQLAFDLVKRYITLLFLTIAAPLWFLAASFPGNDKGYESWIRNMLCNILPFPAVYLGFYFAAYFINFSGQPFFIQGGGAVIKTDTLPLFAGFNPSFVMQVVGYGILLSLPAIPKWLCKVLKADSTDVFGSEINAASKSASGRGGSFVTTLGSKGVKAPLTKMGRSISTSVRRRFP